MLIETANGLVETIHKLELIEPDRLSQLGRLAERFDNPRELAGQLIRREWLTAFQVNQLLQGRGHALRLGHYILLERIASGGMGEVFKAQHCRLRRVAAVKVVSQERLERSNALQRFLREAESAAKLSHPNIIAVYDFGAANESRYLAMELIEGIDLARLVASSGPLPVPLACDFIRQTALGLHHAHEQGFVHRDIKPQNLLVAPRGSRQAGPPLGAEGYAGGTVKILDMGLIRPQMEEIERSLTQHGVVIGTLDYLPPEQALNAHQVDRRADLYSLGCTFYHLLTGEVPFPGGLPMDKLLRHQSEYPTSIRQFRSDVSAELEDIVLSMLAKKPEERIQTAAEAATALTRFSGQASRSGVPIVTVPPSPQRNVFAELEPPENVTTLMDADNGPTLPIISPSRSRIVRPRKSALKMSKRWWPACARVLGRPLDALRRWVRVTTRWTSRRERTSQHSETTRHEEA
jgi:serine/threonine-protein kinase